MALRTTSRRLLTCALAACVLFAHTAAIAYACVRTYDAGYAPASAETVPCPAHADPVPRGRPAGNANVCAVHCQATALPDPSPIVAVPVAIVTLHPAPTPAVHWIASISTPPEPLGAAPPPALRHCRLLI